MNKPFISWHGGKRRLADKILPHFGEHECYVEAFAGAAALYFIKEPVKCEVLNDINGELINLYRVVQNHLEEFVRQFKWALNSRQIFEWEKMKSPETLTDIQRAARFFYLQKVSFSSLGQNYGYATKGLPRLNLLRVEEELSQAHLRLAATNIECLPWQEIIARYDRPHTLFYLDPPYYGTHGYGVEFDLDQYSEMAEMMRCMKGKAVVSVNDIPAMRKAYKGFKIRSVGIKYTVGKSNRKQSKELIITN